MKRVFRKHELPEIIATLNALIFAGWFIYVVMHAPGHEVSLKMRLTYTAYHAGILLAAAAGFTALHWLTLTRYPKLYSCLTSFFIAAFTLMPLFLIFSVGYAFYHWVT